MLFLGNIQCDSIEPPKYGKVIYANEKGQIKGQYEKYQLGTFAEIQCLNDTTLEGENLLTCLDTTFWDYTIPTCIEYKTTTESLTPELLLSSIDYTTISTLTTENTELYEYFKNYSTTNFSTEPERKTTEILSVSNTTINEIATTTASTIDYPNRSFWKELKKFYFYGCPDQTSHKHSALCSLVTKNCYSDLSEFESPNSDDAKHMDKKLLELLQQAKSVNNFNEITIENIFDFILYGLETKDTFSNTIENVYRLVICFYIDTLIIDSTINDDKQPASITDSIKLLIIQLYLHPYQQYQSKMQLETKLLNKRSASNKLYGKCDILELYPCPDNSIIKGKQGLSDYKVDTAQKIPDLVPVGTRIQFECVSGFTPSGRTYTECRKDGTWTPARFECKCK